jgi:thymidylate synthase (FAD)
MSIKMYDKKIYLYDDKIGAVEYIQHLGTDLTVVNAARVSFGVSKETLDDKDKKLIKYLIEHKHTSTLEHNVVTFRFTVPLYTRSQHHRHRTWNFNETSLRYSSENIQFYEPNNFRTQHVSNRQASNQDELVNPLIDVNDPEWGSGLYRQASDIVKEHHIKSVEVYNSLLDSGICREQARGVLPTNLYTQYYGTVNLNNLIKFIDLRTHEGAQWEIQQVARACLEIATDLWPYTIDAYKETIWKR